MKILIVSDARSTHTRRWVKSLKEKGLNIVLFSPNLSPDSFFERERIKIYTYNLFTYKGAKGLRGRLTAPVKKVVNHFGAVRALKKAIKVEMPDLLHAHYLTSYSLIAALAMFRPLVISVWGSDIYEFPKLSLFNKFAVKFSLRRADRVCSTSHIMAKEVAKYYKGAIDIVPFGVDLTLFRPIEGFSPGQDEFVVGCVKSMAPKYGIDTLIKAFKMLCDGGRGVVAGGEAGRGREPWAVEEAREESGEGRALRLVIVGSGPNFEEYRALAEELGLKNVEFRGRVENSRLPEIYNSFSVAVSLSRSESFGVVAVEAMACGCPVVTSDADGFTEVVEDSVTGVIVPKEDAGAAALAIERFIKEPKLREQMGAAGRRRVARLYNWEDNLNSMIALYQKTIDKYYNL